MRGAGTGGARGQAGGSVGGVNAPHRPAPGTPIVFRWRKWDGSPHWEHDGVYLGSDEWGDCYTGVMTENAPELRHIHDRSPVLLDPQDWEAWLTAPFAALDMFDRPFPAERMVIEETNEPWARVRVASGDNPAALL